MSRKIALIIWIIIQITIFILSVYSIFIRHDKDGFTLFYMLEFLVTYPSGYIIGYINYGYYILFGTLESGFKYFEQIYFISYFALFNILGYLQWFIVIPKIYKWIKRKVSELKN